MADEEEVVTPAPQRRQRFRIEPNIRIGEVLVIITVLVGGVSAWNDLKNGNDRNTREIQDAKVIQRDRDDRQDASVGRIESYVKDSIQVIRNDQAEIRTDVREIARSIRGRGG